MKGKFKNLLGIGFVLISTYLFFLEMWGVPIIAIINAIPFMIAETIIAIDLERGIHENIR